jgi:hypothetical protein
MPGCSGIVTALAQVCEGIQLIPPVYSRVWVFVEGERPGHSPQSTILMRVDEPVATRKMP